MSRNMKKMISYYKPYMKIFLTDMFFALAAALVALMIPLVVRYVTATVIYMDADAALQRIILIGGGMTVLVLLQCYCNYYISNYGHVMGRELNMICGLRFLRITRSFLLHFTTTRKSDS